MRLKMARIAIILALPIEYNTSSMLRCKALIAALGAMGHELKCYCPNPDSHSKYFDNKEFNIPGLELFRFGGKAWSEKQEILRQNCRRSFTSRIKTMALRIFRRIDVFGSTLLYLPERKKISNDIAEGCFNILLSFSDPMPAHMIAIYCKKHNPQLRYIQQWGDPLASDTISKTAQPIWIRKCIEEILLKPAEKVCYVSPFTCEEQKKIFTRQAHKMIFLPTPSLIYEENMPAREKISIGYFGSYNSIARDIRPFYNAARQNPEVDFIIIGDSDIKLENTDNITVINRVSPIKLNKYMKEVNVVVCLMNLKGNQIPGKAYHDASSTKDILFIKDGEYGDAIQHFFEQYDHYTFVNNSVSSIDSVIKRYLHNGVPVRKPVKDFNASYIAKKLIE